MRGVLRGLADPGEGPFEGEGRDEAGDVAAEARDLLDEARGDELVVLAGHQEDGLDGRVEAVVHAGHLELVVEIADGAEAADDHGRVDAAGEVDEQAVEALDLDLGAGALGDGGGLGADELDAFLEREHGALAGIDGDADDQAVNEPGGAGDDVHVAVGDRVEGAGVDAHEAAGLRHRAARPRSPGRRW
jgi:hypothetical protein